MHKSNLLLGKLFGFGYIQSCVIVAIVAALLPYKTTLAATNTPSSVNATTQTVNDPNLHYTAESLPKEGIHIPFTLESNYIVISADLAGTRADCLFDTGSWSSQWPKWLSLTGEYMEDSHDSAIDASGMKLSIARVLLSSVCVGNYEAHKVLTASIDTGINSKEDAAKSRSIIDHAPILNGAIFNGTVLTIDYEKREMIVRPGSVDLQLLLVADLNREELATNKAKGHTYVVPFTQQIGQNKSDFGVPVVNCILDGFNVPLIVDTGIAGDSIAIYPSLSSKIINKYKKQVSR